MPNPTPKPDPQKPDPKKSNPHSTPQTPRPSIFLHLNFAATGIAMALPGSILPILLSRWHLPDSYAGLLFFSLFSGTSLGALLARKPIHRALILGNLLFAAACLGIAFSPANLPLLPTLEFSAPLFLFALYGTGLGLVMTSITLLQSTRHVSTQHVRTRPDQPTQLKPAAIALNRLNLTWSIGACLAPTLAAHSLAILNLQPLFTTSAILFTIFFLAALLLEADPHSPDQATHPALILNRLRPARRIPWPLPTLIAILLPTGIEASLGAWTATYTERSQLLPAQFATHLAANFATPLTGHILTLTVTAGTAFWTGLLLSRTLSSFRMKLATRQQPPPSPHQPGPPARTISSNLPLSCALVLFGLILLVSTHVPTLILFAVFLTGFGLGPIYPTLLANALQYSSNSAIFFTAGLGSSLLPWLTGALSSHASSLTIGLSIPLAASFLLLLLTLKLHSPHSASTPPRSPSS